MAVPLGDGDAEGGAGFQEDEEFHLWSVSASVGYPLNKQPQICWGGDGKIGLEGGENGLASVVGPPGTL